MDRLNKLDVYYHDQKIGTMALYQNRLAAFAYSDKWLQEGFSISPFSLPLEKRVFMPKIDPFESSYNREPGEACNCRKYGYGSFDLSSHNSHRTCV